MDQLAADMCCMPPPTSWVSTWLSDPVLAWHLLFGPLVPSQYALKGPGVTREAAELARKLIIGSKL